MRERARIYVPTEGLQPGAMVRLFGPNGQGGVDYNSREGGPRFALARGGAALPGADNDNSPLGMAPLGMERRSAVLCSRPAVFGLRRYGVNVYDAQTYEVASGAPTEVDAFVCGEPLPPTRMEPVAQLVNGSLRFSLTGGELT